MHVASLAYCGLAQSPCTCKAGHQAIQKLVRRQQCVLQKLVPWLLLIESNAHLCSSKKSHTYSNPMTKGMEKIKSHLTKWGWQNQPQRPAIWTSTTCCLKLAIPSHLSHDHNMGGPWHAHNPMGHSQGCVGVHCMPSHAFWMGYNGHYRPPYCFICAHEVDGIVSRP